MILTFVKRVDGHLYNVSPLNGSGNLGSQSLQLLRSHCDMVAKVEVARLVQRHEMNMDMGHVDTHHRFANLDARAHFLQALGHFLCKQMKLAEELIIEVEDIVDLLFGDTQDVTFDDRVDVEEGEAMLRLGHFIARNLTGDNLTENACHNYRSILVSSKVILPAGTLTSTRSPTL